MNRDKYHEEMWTLIRPKPGAKSENGVTAGAVLLPDEVEALKRVSQAMGMSRSEFLRASFLKNFAQAEAAGVLEPEKA